MYRIINCVCVSSLEKWNMPLMWGVWCGVITMTLSAIFEKPKKKTFHFSVLVTESKDRYSFFFDDVNNI